MAENWENIRQNFIEDVQCGVYIDRTEVLEQFEDTGNYMVRLPKGLGKTTLLATVGCFYGMCLNEKDPSFGKEGREFVNAVFGRGRARNFSINDVNCTSVRNMFGTLIPVYFSFPEACKNYYQLFIEKIKDLIIEFDFCDNYASVYGSVCVGDSSRLDFCNELEDLSNLCFRLYCQFGGQVIFLIDNFEQPFYAKKQFPMENADGESFVSLFTDLQKLPCVHSIVVTTADQFFPKDEGFTDSV